MKHPKNLVHMLLGGMLLASAAANAVEYPIGTPQQRNGMEIAAVYLHPVVMEPDGIMKKPEESDIHMEADIRALANNPNGFAEGEWIPYLIVKFEVTKQGSNEKISGDFMPMVANDGPHYGDNVKLKGPGKYTVKYKISPPTANPEAHFGRHTDRLTGVRPWFKPFEVEYEFTYVGIGKKGAIDMLPFKPKHLAVALAGAMLAGAIPALAAEPSQADLLKELRRLSERMEKLEARNAELEKKVQSTPAKPDGELAQRVKTLEENNARMETALESDRLSEKDPEVITRLKDIEFRTLSMQKQARMIESLEGITAGASLTMVAQSVNKAAVAAGEPGSALNYRGDVSVTLPGGVIGNAEGRIFAQFRLGQGNGLALNNTYTSTPNTTAFSLTNPDDSTAMLAQAWYQLDVPLPFGGYKPHSREHLEINFGKIDPFVFFDQNVAADDESSKFLNNAFVHNPLLDSGGDAGVDAYGFTPGMRIAYHNETQKPEWWRASLGVFGAGKGAGYDRTFSSPFVIGQLEFGRKFFGGLDGTYRLYAWRNGQSTAFQNEFDTAIERHSGWGASIDQRVGDATTVFGRYGKSLSGNVRFDQALTVGAEFGGSYWNRSADGIGVALGWLRTSGNFQGNSTTLDSDADGNPDFGYTATGSEQLAEIYYRTRINKNLEFTPDFQLIRHPGGDKTASTAKVIGLRAKVSF